VKLTAVMAASAQVVKAWVNTNHGEFRVADDPTDPYVLLAAGSFKSFVVVLAFAAASQTGGNVLANEMQEVVLEAFLGRAIDLRADPGAWLYKDAAAAGPKALLTLLDELRAELFGIEFAEDEDTETASAENMGVTPVSLPDGTPLRAYMQKVKWTVRVG
jgi:hypothetical protein